MARPSSANPEAARIAELAQRFVPVRVTDLRPLDLERFRFDFDLTFAAMTLAPDGRVLHRYGGRDERDAQSHLSMASLAKLLQGTLAELAETEAAAKPAAVKPAADAASAGRTIEQLPTFRKRDAEKRVECVHCHTVNDFEMKQAIEDGRWRREQMWNFPDPARLGLEVDRDDQQQVAKVVEGSPAARAGVHAGDRLLRAQQTPLLTRADLQWALQQLPFEGATLELEVERSVHAFRAPPNESVDLDERHAVHLELPAGWKVAPPLEYAWRPYKWNVPPQPGFGGKLLTAEEKRALGLDPNGYAEKITYLVTWGEKADTGRNAQKAGLRKDDVLLSLAGKTDFVSEDHVQAWFRLTQRPGTTIDIVLLRDGKRVTVTMPVIE